MNTANDLTAGSTSVAPTESPARQFRPVLASLRFLAVEGYQDSEIVEESAELLGSIDRRGEETVAAALIADAKWHGGHGRVTCEISYETVNGPIGELTPDDELQILNSALPILTPHVRLAIVDLTTRLGASLPPPPAAITAVQPAEPHPGNPTSAG